METDSEHLPRHSPLEDAPLPTPCDTPYQTPRIPGSRMSSFGTSGTISPATPPPLPPDYISQPKGLHNGDNNSTYDAEHFNSSLHASLVSEILSVRRDLESKNRLVEELETHLSHSRNESETLQSSLQRSGKESRALKRELALHEDGTLSAMESLAKEKDEVNEINSDLKRKLELAQKRFRAQEEENTRLRSSIEAERARWTNERRHLDRKATLAQTRLQSVFDELAAREAQASEASKAEFAGRDSFNDPSRNDTDDASSITSLEHHSQRHLKYQSSLGSITELKKSLADELGADESDEDNDSQADMSTADRTSRDSPSKGMQEKRFSQTEEGQARKVLGIVSAFEGKLRESSSPEAHRVSFPKHVRDSMASSKYSDKHSSISSRPDTEEPKAVDRDANTNTDYGEIQSPTDSLPATPVPEIEANQRRKRDPLPSQPRFSHSRTKSDPSPSLQSFTENQDDELHVADVSSPGPVAAPSQESPSKHILSHTEAPSKTEMCSSSTQTEPLDQTIGEHTVSKPDFPIPPPPDRAAPQRPVVPTITVHPPENASDSLQSDSVLPPNTKNIGCQTTLDLRVCTRSVSVQTEAIRIDKRMIKLPPHLLPSALQDKAESTWDPPSIRGKSEQKVKSHGSDHSDRSFPPPLPPLEEFSDAVSGDTEADVSSTIPKRRTSSRLRRKLSRPDPELDPYDELDDLDASDGEDISAPAIGRLNMRSQKQGKPAFEPPEPVPENEKVVSALPRQPRSRQSNESHRSLEKGKRLPRWPGHNDAMVQHQARLSNLARGGSSNHSRSPSLGSAASSSNFSKSSGPRPPFAIPARRSSKEASSHDLWRASNQSSPTRRAGRLTKKPGSVRKARSAANIAEAGRSSISAVKAAKAPGAFTFERVPEYPQRPPPVPKEIGPRQHKRADPSTSSQLQDLSSVYPTGNASIGSSLQPSLVDSLTASMIGEWMWKYVRKRKSFGRQETPAEPGKTSDVRHKRWVWLSPYERTIMWSSKQPASNSALMGKTGRKLSIQSVLDVKDETSPPKGAAGLIFNRSILVLTPARALKFTAGSRERHYMWLTALSFLSHSSSPHNPRLSFLMADPPPAPSFHESESSGRRSRASSFLRSSKTKTASQQSSGHATPTAQQQEANILRKASNAQLPDSAYAPHVPRVPHRRKRSATGPSRGRPSIKGYPGANASSNNSMLSAGNSSARVQSQSRASSSRSFRAAEIEEEGHPLPELEPRLAVPDDASPRQSMASAEFGGNSNFFDAVGVVRMDAFMKPGSSLQTMAKSGASAAHGQGEGSGDSFYGPPDISRHRPPNNKTGNKSRADMFSGF